MRPADEESVSAAAADSQRSGSGSGDTDSEDGSGGEEEWAVGGGARALAALDALRRSREHYDVVVAGGGVEVPAHRALLAAASPYLLRALPACGPAAEPLVCRVRAVAGSALEGLVAAAYSGRLAVGDAAAALQLYTAAWTLRMEAARAMLADRLSRRLTPPHALAVRALPDLPAHHQDALDHYIDQHFDEICANGALSTLPLLQVELVACSSAAGGGEAARAVAAAALTWLRHRHQHTSLSALTARTHLAYVDAAGALRDCDELPEGQAGAALIQEYRAAVPERRDRAPPDSEEEDDEEGAAGEVAVTARQPRPEWRVVAARGGAGVTRALLQINGRLAAARIAWRDVGAGVTQGGPLGGAREAAQGGERRAPLPGGRAAMGAAALGGRLVVCGGYDRAAALRDAAAYCPATNRWAPLPPPRVARARMSAAVLGDRLYVLGGSDGHHELDSVDVYSAAEGWRAGGRLPLAVSQAGAAADPAGGALWLVGGWGGGRPLKGTLVYREAEGQWREGPALVTARSQVCCVRWAGALWAVGGCDAWHCLASTETLPLSDAAAAWSEGPAMSRPRRSVGGAAWRGLLVAAGGSDGAASLTRCERLSAPSGPWQPAPALRQPRATPALVPIDDVLYAVGGFDGKEFLSSVECLYEPDGEWTSLCTPPPPPPPNSASDTADVATAKPHDGLGESAADNATRKEDKVQQQPAAVNGQG